MNFGYGIFAPNGELEAVELSEGMALDIAMRLSPDQKAPNRAVLPVTITPGVFDERSIVALVDALLPDIRERVKNKIHEADLAANREHARNALAAK